MGPFRLTVTPRGKGYVATCGELDVTSFAMTPVGAAESARKMTLATVGKTPHAEVLLLRVDVPGVSTIVMQPLDRPVSLAVGTGGEKWRYMATVSGEVTLKKAT